MIYISTDAGVRLARAKSRYDATLRAHNAEPNNIERYRDFSFAWAEKEDAADAVADELVSMGFGQEEV